MKTSFFNFWKGTNEVLVSFICYLGVAALDVGLHWLAGRNYSWCKFLLAFHTYRNPINMKGNCDDLDIVLPSLLLGVSMAIAERYWSKKVILYVWIGNAVGVVALLPIYTLILGKNIVWWWPQTSADLVGFFISQLFKALLLIGVVAYGVRKAFFNHTEENGARPSLNAQGNSQS